MSIRQLPLKYLFLIICLGTFLVWLGWYTVQYLRIERTEVLKTASLGLTCPEERITVGPGYQFNDGPNEFPVAGCAKKGRVFCDDNGSRYGMLQQYFVVDMACRFEMR